MDDGTLLRVWLGLPQNLVGNWSGISLSEEYETNHVHEGVALGPAEVAVRRLTGRVAQMYQEGGYGIGHRRTLGAKHLIAADIYTPHLQHVLEFRRVFHVDL